MWRLRCTKRYNPAMSSEQKHKSINFVKLKNTLIHCLLKNKKRDHRHNGEYKLTYKQGCPLVPIIYKENKNFTERL